MTPAWLRATLLFGWGAACVAGLGSVWSYKTRAGDRGNPHGRWPATTGLVRSETGPTLVLFLHPRCPCSGSSLEELESVLVEASGRALVQVVIFAPSSRSEEWARTSVWRSAGRHGEVVVRADRDAVEARRFGAATSGHAFVYDREGRLRFSGGITGVRGHPGHNPGRQAVIDLLTRGSSFLETTPVFGCPILDPSSSNLP